MDIIHSELLEVGYERFVPNNDFRYNYKSIIIFKLTKVSKDGLRDQKKPKNLFLVSNDYKGYYNTEMK